MSAYRAIRLLRYLGTIGGSISLVALAAAFAIPASLEAVESREATKAPVRISYGQELPRLSAAEMNITHMLPVKAQQLAAPKSTVATTAPVEPPDEATEVYIITASSLNIRSRPSSNSSIVASLKEGSEVEIIEAKGSWSRVRREGQDLGWAYEKYLEPVKQTDERVASLQ